MITLGIKPKTSKLSLKGPKPDYYDLYCLGTPNYGTYYSNSCKWPPQGLGTF